MAAISKLNIATRVERTEAEGPGQRYAIWVQGCPMRCPGCCNPTLLQFRDAQWCDVEVEFSRIRDTDDVEGVTFLGGEPFSQAAALASLAAKVRAAGLSVMVFTGYTLQQLQSTKTEGYDALLGQTDLLVDGPYIKELHVTDRRWIGSSNQVVHFLTDRYQHMSDEIEGWDSSPNTIELRLSGSDLTINGFPNPDLVRIFGSRKR